MTAAEDPLAHVDPWIALQDGRAQLLRALDACSPSDAARAVADTPGWSIADLLTHLAAWDELTARFLRALAGGAVDATQEAAPEHEWRAWNAAQLAAAHGQAFADRVERLRAARAELLEAAGAVDHERFDEAIASSWGTHDTVRAYLVGQAMHDGLHAEAIANARAGA